MVSPAIERRLSAKDKRKQLVLDLLAQFPAVHPIWNMLYYFLKGGWYVDDLDDQADHDSGGLANAPSVFDDQVISVPGQIKGRCDDQKRTHQGYAQR